MASLKDYLERLLRLIDAYQRCATGSEESDRAALQGALQEADLAFLREDAMALLQESREGLERVKKIVRDLREFSRVDSASWQESDLIAGLESTVNVAASELAGKVDVVRQYADLPLVRCHLAQINQVFLSLLTNALQAIEGHGQIALSAGVQGDEVWVRVQDNGVGMSPEVQRRMFEPFFTTRAVGQGVGLGLSVAYDTVKNHGGRIDVGSEPGRGTWVQVWLPVNGSEAAPGAP